MLVIRFNAARTRPKKQSTNQSKERCHYKEMNRHTEDSIKIFCWFYAVMDMI
jgi:hypothetical protein